MEDQDSLQDPARPRSIQPTAQNAPFFGAKERADDISARVGECWLIVRIDPSGRMPYAEYSLSDPLGIAALHLISTLAQNLTG